LKALATAWHGIAGAFATPSAATLFFLGFGCGLPFLLVGYTLSIWLREAQYDLGAIGLVSYATLFYVFKFVWAPLLDRYRVPMLGRLGRRRGWMLLSQAMLAVALLAMAITGPQASLGLFVGLVGLVALAGATQDTVVDAYRIEIAAVEAQAALAATYTLGYRLALIASGAGALYLADAAGWQAAYTLMAALMLLPLGAALLAREPVAASPGHPGLGAAFIGPFLEFFGRNGIALALALLAFVGLFKMPDQMLGVIAGPFYVDSGFDKSQIATVSKLMGVWVGIAGTFLGGAAVAGFGLRGPLVVAVVAVAMSNLFFVLMAQHPKELWVFVLTICGDNLAQGFAGTVLVAFMSSLADRNYTATQYALLSSLANLPGKLIGGAAGWMAEAWGYAGFFVVSTVSVVPTLLLLAWLWPRTRLQGHGG
jgi:PAT family beta-lactamase induction signal transducer AmpG